MSTKDVNIELVSTITTKSAKEIYSELAESRF